MDVTDINQPDWIVLLIGLGVGLILGFIFQKRAWAHFKDAVSGPSGRGSAKRYAYIAGMAASIHWLSYSLAKHGHSESWNWAFAVFFGGTVASYLGAKWIYTKENPLMSTLLKEHTPPAPVAPKPTKTTKPTKSNSDKTEDPGLNGEDE